MMKAQQRAYYFLDYSKATDVIKWRMWRIQQTIDVKLRNVRLLLAPSRPCYNGTEPPSLLLSPRARAGTRRTRLRLPPVQGVVHAPGRGVAVRPDEQHVPVQRVPDRGRQQRE